MASGSESAKEEHYHNLTSKQREQILGKIFIINNNKCYHLKSFQKAFILSSWPGLKLIDSV